MADGDEAINMDQSMRSALAGVLESYDQRRERDIAAREAEQASVDKFLVDATATLVTIVAPRFEQFAQELKQHNHDCSIEMKKPDAVDKLWEAMIKLTIFPDGIRLAQGNASLSYIASSHRQILSAHRSVSTRNGGLIPGTIGEYELARITPARVDQDLLELAQAVFAAP